MRNGFKMEIDLRQIWRVLMPSSSSRGGSSSKEEKELEEAEVKMGAEKDEEGAAPTSKDMKGRGLELGIGLGFEGVKDGVGTRRWLGMVEEEVPVDEDDDDVGKTTGGTLNSRDMVFSLFLVSFLFLANKTDHNGNESLRPTDYSRIIFLSFKIR